MRKIIRPGGAIEMVREEHDDMIATLEQENRQLHARNQRLEQELEIASNNGIDELRNKLDMRDKDKFEAFRLAIKALAACFNQGNQGVLIADIGEKVSIIGINAEMHQVALMATAAAVKLDELIDDLQNEDRVLN